MKHASSKTHALPYCMHGVFAKTAMKDADHDAMKARHERRRHHRNHSCIKVSFMIDLKSFMHHS